MTPALELPPGSPPYSFFNHGDIWSLWPFPVLSEGCRGSEPPSPPGSPGTGLSLLRSSWDSSEGLCTLQWTLGRTGGGISPPGGPSKILPYAASPSAVQGGRLSPVSGERLGAVPGAGPPAGGRGTRGRAGFRLTRCASLQTPILILSLETQLDLLRSCMNVTRLWIPSETGTSLARAGTDRRAGRILLHAGPPRPALGRRRPGSVWNACLCACVPAGLDVGACSS